MRRIIGLLFVLLTLAGARGQSGAITVAGTPRQGNPIFVTVTGVAPGTEGSVRWNNQRWDIAKADEHGRMRTVLPVAVDMPNGARPMIVELADGTPIKTTVAVQARWFPEQHLWINPVTMSHYDDPQNHADDDAILARLKQYDPVQRWHGSLHMPIQARESTGYGERRTYNGGVHHSWHKGLDLAGNEGTPIHATASGVVIHVAHGLVNGNTVVLSHGLGLGSVYLHMDSIAVHEGQTVNAGDEIGRVGGTGGFAPHLHWETRVQGYAVDPHSLLSLPDGWR